MARPSPAWRAFLLPRPLSLLANSIHFAGGVLLAGLEATAATPRLFPQGAIFIFVWWIVQEALVQQAKYQWNDLRDHRRDPKLPANARRPLAGRGPSVTAYILLVIRWLGGVLLAAWLSPRLFWLVVTISVLQGGYEWWAKPRAARWPLLPLVFVALGAAVKLLGGLMAVGGGTAAARFWLYGVGAVGLGVIYGATLWRVEADYLQRRGLPWQRGQSAHFAAHGRFWQGVGAFVGLAAGLLLLATAGAWPQRAAALLFLLAVAGIGYHNATIDYGQFYFLHAVRHWPTLRRARGRLPWWQWLHLAWVVNTPRFPRVLQRYERPLLREQLHPQHE